MTVTEMLLVLAATVITYGMRVAFLLSKRRIAFPPLVRIALRHIPTAALAALLLPPILIVNDALVLSIDNHKLLAAVIALIAGIYMRNLFIVVLIGLSALWLLNLSL